MADAASDAAEGCHKRVALSIADVVLIDPGNVLLIDLGEILVAAEAQPMRTLPVSTAIYRSTLDMVGRPNGCDFRNKSERTTEIRPPNVKADHTVEGALPRSTWGPY